MADEADGARGGADGAISLDAVREAFGLAAHELQAFDPARPRFDAQRPLLVLPGQMAAAAPRIAERYPAAHPARALIGGAARPRPARGLPRSAGAWLVEALAPHDDLRAADGLRAILARLCGPDGCPWDGAQTHESLRGALLEESYEAVEAIDRGDAGGLREELGDLLLQIVFHATIAEAAGEFTLDDVIEAINRKLLRRHPHVFADGEAGDADEAWARWDEIKAQERAAGGGDASPAGALASLPRALPALQRAQTLAGRAGRAGLGPPEPDPLDALGAALQALREAGAPAAPPAGRTAAAGRLGALLWHAARYARAHGVDAESALRERTHRFAEAAGAQQGRAGGAPGGPGRVSSGPARARLRGAPSRREEPMTSDTSVVTPERFASGLPTFAAWMDAIEGRREEFQRHYDEYEPDPGDLAAVRALTEAHGVRALVLGEHWCPDVWRGLPVIARIAEGAGMELRLFFRDRNKDIMSEFLKDGEFESIPTIVFYDRDHRCLGHWIERPALANEEMEPLRAILAGAERGTPAFEDARARYQEETWKLAPDWRHAQLGEIRALLEGALG